MEPTNTDDVDGEPAARKALPRYDAVIIGAGFAGLAMGRRLKLLGVENFVILERGNSVGGVWRDNRYPGAACDVPSHLYSYSFFLNPDWSRKYSPQSEILAYLERAAAEFGLLPHIKLGQTVTALKFYPDAGLWRVKLASGKYVDARTVISAVGQLSEPVTPDIKDSELFEGTMVHSARWAAKANYAGKRVAVIGNAASAIQLIPKLAETARNLTIFQRTPNWVVNKPDRSFTKVEKWLFRKLPVWHRIYRRISFIIHESRYSAFVKNSIASDFTRWRLKRRLKREVSDPVLREMLTPNYPPGCKRILLSSDFYNIVQKPNVRVVARRPARLDRDGIITPDGERIGVDAIIFATGFKATEFLAGLTVIGPEGKTLKDAWGASPRAYRGVAVSGFPNLFMMYGPNTNLGHNSIIYMLEQQSAYIGKQVSRLLSEDLRTLDVDPEAEARFNKKLQKRLRRTVWAADCPSWYKTEDGLITNNWHGHASEFAGALKKKDEKDWIANS
ncbi:NAD(P)/FAD-dependent oxidoreductase [Maricaulaceae bacterium EIL42A08]|nr:NAD(P)/FAD-dependent oxidoreductase [Maricaulaceae bacterium EIL42A08]